MTLSNSAVALVTGASSGIGLATARALRETGFRVFGTSRTGAMGQTDDITMLPNAVKRTVDEVLNRAGSIEVLVNNAGVGLLGGAEESSVTQARSLFDVNVFGVMRMTNAVLPAMRRQRRGRIVNLSSILGLIPAPYLSLYASTKHAIEGYSESLDHELREFGIRVVLVEPGYTRTAFGANTTGPDWPLAFYDARREAAQAYAQKNVEGGDSPETVAEMIVHAATEREPKARYTAGKLAGQARLLRRFVPESAFAKSLRKQNNLPA
jgi:short-subunit dehydrogenase